MRPVRVLSNLSENGEAVVAAAGVDLHALARAQHLGQLVDPPAGGRGQKPVAHRGANEVSRIVSRYMYR